MHRLKCRGMDAASNNLGTRFSALRIGRSDMHFSEKRGKYSALGNHSPAAIAEKATWRGIGAVFGALIGGLFISSQYLVAGLIIAVLIMVSLLIVHSRRIWRAFKLSYLWK